MNKIIMLLFGLFLLNSYVLRCQSDHFLSENSFEGAKVKMSELVASKRDTITPHTPWLLNHLGELKFENYQAISATLIEKLRPSETVISCSFLEVYSFHSLIDKFYCIIESSDDQFFVTKFDNRLDLAQNLGVVNKDFFSKMALNLIPNHTERIGEDYMFLIKFHASGISEVELATNIDFTTIDLINLTEEMLFNP